MIIYIMNWKVEFFNEVVKQETLQLPPKILAKMLHIFELIELMGANFSRSKVKLWNAYKR